MSTVAIVTLALIGGAAAILVLLGIGILLWAAFKLHGSSNRLETDLMTVREGNREIMEKSQAEMLRVNTENAKALRSEVESAKAAFTAIRNDLRQTSDSLVKTVENLLSAHQLAMMAAVDKINAEALQKAAAQNIKAVQELSKCVALFQQMLLANEPQAANEYGPEDYAPESESRFGPPSSHYGVGTTARLDQEVEAEERGETVPAGDAEQN